MSISLLLFGPQCMFRLCHTVCKVVWSLTFIVGLCDWTRWLA